MISLTACLVLPYLDPAIASVDLTLCYDDTSFLFTFFFFELKSMGTVGINSNNPNCQAEGRL